MAEHDEKLFEHEFAEKLRKFDDNIKIPEIPDAQSIFDRAESEKTKVIPFKKYSRYIAAAAAVVLICVSIPIFSAGASAEFAPQEPMEAPKMFDNMADCNSDTVIAEEPCEAAPEETYYPEFSVTDGENSANESFDGTAENEAESVSKTENVLEEMLFEFFNSTVSAEIKDSSAVSSSDANPATGGNGETGRELAVEYDANGEISMLLEKINKKRSIEIVIEEDSVSVMLFDISAGDEVISAFWVEGNYEDSYSISESYLICLSKKITEEDFKEENYLPMAGDSVNGTYFISEDDINLPGKVRYGEVFIVVEIDLKTGDYEIHASLR